MSARPATRRRSPRTRNGPAKVIRMPTPTVVRRRRAIKTGIGLLVISLVAAIIARFYLMYCAPPSPEKVSGLTDQETEILGLVNQQRVRGGLRPLKFSARLAVIARGHSYDMAMRHYLAHNSPDGVAPADRISGVGIGYRDGRRKHLHGRQRRFGRRRPARDERLAEESRASRQHRLGQVHRDWRRNRTVRRRPTLTLRKIS